MNNMPNSPSDPDAQAVLRWVAQTHDVILHKISKIDTVVEVQAQQGRTLEKLADTVGRLAVIEERQNTTLSTISEVRKSQDELEGRVDKLEQAEQLNKQARYWLFGAIGIAAAGVLYAIMRNVGL